MCPPRLGHEPSTALGHPKISDETWAETGKIDYDHGHEARREPAGCGPPGSRPSRTGGVRQVPRAVGTPPARFDASRRATF